MTEILSTSTALAVCETSSHQELNRTKGFLGGTLGEVTEVAVACAPALLAAIRALGNDELLHLSELAMQDIGDNLLVLDELRQRFKAGKHFKGYVGWSDFVARNSRYSLRVIQTKLAEVNGKDETKVNKNTGNMYTRGCNIHGVPFKPTPRDIYWVPPANKPDIKGWSSMDAGEKHRAGQEAGCEYCLTYPSARSCAVHGWTEKRHDHEPHTSGTEDLSGKTFDKSLFVHELFDGSGSYDGSRVWLVENLKTSAAELWRTCDLSRTERKGERVNKCKHGAYDLSEGPLTGPKWRMLLQLANERLADIKADIPIDQTKHDEDLNEIHLWNLQDSVNAAEGKGWYIKRFPSAFAGAPPLTGGKPAPGGLSPAFAKDDPKRLGFGLDSDNGLPRRWNTIEREEKPYGCTLGNLRDRIEEVATHFDNPFTYLGLTQKFKVPTGATQAEALLTRKTLSIPAQWKDVKGKIKGTTNVQWMNGNLLNRLISAVENGETEPDEVVRIEPTPLGAARAAATKKTGWVPVPTKYPVEDYSTEPATQVGATSRANGKALTRLRTDLARCYRVGWETADRYTSWKDAAGKKVERDGFVVSVKYFFKQEREAKAFLCKSKKKK